MKKRLDLLGEVAAKVTTWCEDRTETLESKAIGWNSETVKQRTANAAKRSQNQINVAPVGLDSWEPKDGNV